MKNKIKECELSEQAGDLVMECYNFGYTNGYNDAKKKILRFLDKSAKNLNFGSDSPNTVISELIKIIENQEKKMVKK